MDIYEYLKKDHQKVSHLFKQFKKAPAKRKPEIATLIADELIAHAKSEQEIFYQALELFRTSEDEALHGYKEHKEIEEQIKTFDNKTVSESALENSIEKLKKLVDHHVRDEEGKLFREAKKVLSTKQGFALKELMHDLKHQYLLKRQKQSK